jgi:glycerol-3-phosphate dehydrogenase (NAD(P)+)
MFDVIADGRVPPAYRRAFGTELRGRVAAGRPTVIVAAARSRPRQACRQFASLTLRVYSSTDVVGVEIGGVVKNIMAIATGVSDGLGFGHNARAATITRGLAEITRLAVSLGARPETWRGFGRRGSGTDLHRRPEPQSSTRNSHWTRGESGRHSLPGIRMVAEGVRNTKAVKTLASRQGIELPIVDVTYSVLYEGWRRNRRWQSCSAVP